MVFSLWMILPLYPAPAHSAEVTIKWDANTEPKLAGYRIHYGLKSQSYDQMVDVGNRTQHTLQWLMDETTYYFAITAYDVYGNESPFSREIQWTSVSPWTPREPRIAEGLLSFYTFSERGGATVFDRSPRGQPLDLDVLDLSAVQWTEGGLTIRSPTMIVSHHAAAKITDAVRQSNEITLEAWIRPANTRQNGPARIITLSSDPHHRNFTLGQGVFGGSSSVYDVRFRSTATSSNGEPSLTSPHNSLTAQLTHVVYTRNSSGTTRIFLDGNLVQSGRTGGTLSNWDRSMRLTLGNEVCDEDRSWLGEYRLMAIYDRALSHEEIVQNFLAGSDGW